jgi:hypothetical protein
VVGEAIVVEVSPGRSRKAVLLHPTDFELFDRLLELEIAATRAFPPTR